MKPITCTDGQLALAVQRANRSVSWTSDEVSLTLQLEKKALAADVLARELTALRAEAAKREVAPQTCAEVMESEQKARQVGVCKSSISRDEMRWARFCAELNTHATSAFVQGAVSRHETLLAVLIAAEKASRP
jgi:hypothetical protein